MGASIIEVLRDEVRLTATARRPPLARNALKATGQNRKRELRAVRSVARHYRATANFGNPLQKLRQLGDIHRDPARLTAQADIETAPRASAAT